MGYENCRLTFLRIHSREVFARRFVRQYWLVSVESTNEPVPSG